MRIDGTFGFGTFGVGDGKNAASKAGKSGSAHGASAMVNDPVIADLAASYVGQVQAVEDVNLSAVAEARRLLESGELSSPEAIRRAAQSIVDLGV